MSNKIDSCPFCGSKYISVIVPVETEYQVQCGNCYASSSIESTAKKAIKAWNCHAPSEQSGAANKKADDNPPLTLEELKSRKSPVWCVVDDCSWIPDGGCYCLCDCGAILPPSTNPHSAEECLAHDWVFLGRKPEEET